MGTFREFLDDFGSSFVSAVDKGGQVVQHGVGLLGDVGSQIWNGSDRETTETYREGNIGQQGAETFKIHAPAGNTSQIPTFTPTVAPNTVAGPQTVQNPDIGSFLRGNGVAQLQSHQDAYAAFERQRALEQQKRANAIARAGRGAAAPYNARIAAIDENMAKIKGQMERVLPLFGQKIANQQNIYGRAGDELETSYDDAIRDADTFTREASQGISEAYTDAQRNASAVVSKIGGDNATQQAVAAEVGRFEQQIWEMSERGGIEMNAIMQAAEDLAVASARATGATNALELKRKEVETEMEFKQQLQDLADQRRQAQRARAAAVRAAREAAAARWPSTSMNRQNFGAMAGELFLQGQLGKLNLDERDEEAARAMIVQMAGSGMKTWEAKRILEGDPATAEKFGIDLETAFAGFSDEQLSTFATFVPDTLGAMNIGKDDWDRNIAGVDPWDLPPDTMARRAALENFASINFPSMEPEEISYFGRDEANHGSEKPAYMDALGSIQYGSGETSHAGTGSGGSSIFGGSGWGSSGDSDSRQESTGYGRGGM